MSTGGTLDRILLVAEKPAIAASLEGGLTASGIQLTHIHEGDGVFTRLREETFSAILLGSRISDEVKFEICEKIRWEDPMLPILFLSDTGHPDQETALELPDPLHKPYKPRELVAWMRRWAPCDITRAEFQPVDLMGLLRVEIKKQNAADPESAPIDAESLGPVTGDLWVSGEPRLVRRLISMAFAKAREAGSPHLEIVVEREDPKEVVLIVRGDRSLEMVRLPKLHTDPPRKKAA